MICNNHVVTINKYKILNLLRNEVLTAKEIYQILGKEHSIDLVTVYRNLETLQGEGLINKVEIGDKTAHFEAVSLGSGHHHHAVCTNCRTIKHINLDEGELNQQAATISQFKIDRHNLEFFGLCQSCQTGN
jgi:Fe2+ or Zn2+ uptake regulation protein